MNPQPRAIAAWCGAGLISSLITTNPVHRLLILLVACNVCVALRRTDSRVLPILVGVGVATTCTIVINLLASHGGDHVLAVIPTWVPGVNGAVTLEALVYGAALGLGIAAATLTAAPLMLAIESDQLVEALPRHLERTGAAIGGSLNLVPRLLRTTGEIRESQRVRGWMPSGPPRWREIVVPAFLTSVEDSVQLAEAMEARGFGSGRRTRWPEQTWTTSDVVVVAASGAALIVEITARLTGSLGDWFPFPSLSPPLFPAASLVAAALLLMPVIVWRR